MAQYALIDLRSGRICELAPQVFPAATPLVWREVADDLTMEHRWDPVLEVFVKPAPPFDIASRVAGNGLARQNRMFNRDLQADPLRALARRAGARRRSIAKL
jgi:hypothetical protein